MDLLCPKCGEPWELLYITDEAKSLGYDSPREAHAAFAKDGCVALGEKCNTDTLGCDEAQISSALYDVMGDDVDGVAAILDDLVL